MGSDARLYGFYAGIHVVYPSLSAALGGSRRQESV